MTEGESAVDHGGKREGIRFNVLGALECWTGGRRLPLGGTKAERVMGFLLLSHNRSVPVARLVEAVWDSEPPSTAAHQIRKTVSALRRSLPGGTEILHTDGAGYRAVVSADQLDLKEFEELLHTAAEANSAGRATEAGAGLRAALDVWRGPVLDGLDGEAIGTAANVLVEMRLAAVEQYARLRMRTGRLDDLATYLRQYVDAHPLRESLRELLMTVLYRTGRHADALEEYAAVRHLLAEELGADPSPQLAKLHEAILRQSPELADGPPAAPPVEPAAPKPVAARCTLPYDLPDFTGRQDVVRRILTALADGRRFIMIDGMGGSGKTALAVHVAKLLAERYPDGQLFLDLHGFTPGHAPLQPLDALDLLLRSLGIASDRIPEGLSERRALWRSVTANQRLLVVLDNVRDCAQVQPLLLSAENSATIVTSRTRLVEIDGAEWCSVGSLSMEDSMELLSKVLGDERDDVESRTLLAGMCAGLPLALRIASARLRNRPQWTVRYLVDRMRSEARTLTELRVGERSVAASLQLSYRAMSEPQRAAFRMLGWHPGADFDVFSAAALFGTDALEAETILEELLDVNLLEQHTMGRYTLHDLVRWFARDLRGSGPADRHRAGVQQLLDHYLLTLERACDLIFPGRARHPVPLPEGSVVPGLDSESDALSWLDKEYPALRDAAQLAYDVGLDLHAAYLPRGLAFYLNLRGWWTEFRDVELLAVRAARRLDDPLLLRISLTNLAMALWKVGDIRGSLTELDEALALAEQAAEVPGVAACLSRIGMCYSSLGQYTRALDTLRRALDLHRRLGCRREEAEALANIASALNCLGRYTEAADAAALAVRLDRLLGERDHEIYALTELAVAHLGTGRPDLALFRLSVIEGGPDGLCQPGTAGLMLAYRAETLQRLGRSPEADACTARALALMEVSGAIRRAEIGNVLGRVHRRRHDYAAALKLHRSAYRHSAAMDLRVEMARAQAGVAATADAMGDAATARTAREAAHELFAGLGVPAECRWPD
ncbi:BTAD domain-containing putative transcriptional regulator [Streptomyces sp. MK5]|uniref:AfsR/SARP family transcriptional regulator n=1 Tax=Streptomyces sp. MK5 TaxID=3064253 RepID=UPI0027428B31|nr:BTAD domain-containing putative transcriptional regulator [Streptomyces sp. MK5]